jgi:alanine dehydrogenase
LVKPGFNVLIEKGAGSPSFFSDADYEAAGAKIVETDDVWKSSDIVMKVIILYLILSCVSLVICSLS